MAAVCLSLLLPPALAAWRALPPPFTPLSTPRPTLRHPVRHPAPHAFSSAAVYRVRLPMPLGIRFEEASAGAPEGVVVAELLPSGSALADGRVLVGDKLVSCSAVAFGGEGALLSVGASRQFTAWERRLLPCAKLDFETVMAALASNSGRFGYVDIVLELQHTEASVPRPAGGRGARDEAPRVEWDAGGGTRADGRSTPIRPVEDNF
ncbi:hypothetical protein AB1Y20_017066 [Prymnesium parvum]|uniref:PDZ domain-containing protein n=1 Tax=Prymnesium parvum TaxID=97485 RepID=A0AB34IBJ7_PRYPA